MINPNDISTVSVGQLPDGTFALTNKIAHEIGTELYRGTIQELCVFISNYISTADGVGFRAVTVTDGQTLPTTTQQEFILVGKGTYYNVEGGATLILTEELNAIVSNGTYWFVGVEIPVNVELAGITQFIRSGFVSTTPSESAVFDALALKADLTDVEDVANKTSAISGYSETLYPNEKASHDALDLKLNISDLPTNLTLYPTTTASDVSGYVVMVKDIHDVRYNTTAVDVSTPTITTTDQLVSQRISDAGILIGQPGVFNITTFGNIRHLSGSGTATFYFKVFHRDSAGVETLICTSSISAPVTDGGYSEFTASGVWDDGDFVASDRIVIKSYANRIAGGSDPVYQFQFGGASPVRTLLPVPFSVVDAGYELSANKQNDLTPDGTGTKYPTVDAVNALSVNTIADLKLISGPTSGQVITLMGYYVKGDKRPVNYTWNSTSTTADNGGSIIKITAITTGRWIASLGIDVTVKDFGAKGDNINDDTSSIQNMVNTYGCFKLGKGIFKITNTITIPTTTFPERIFSGDGPSESVIKCIGMVGLVAIESDPTTVYIKLTMRDFEISGDADTCIKLTPLGQVYQSQFNNLTLSSGANSSIIVSPHFSCSWHNVHTKSASGHGFDLQGGNSTLLTNCYAHNSGAGKAGYRIKGNATLISCNGVDDGDIWGWFGSSVSEDGINTIAKIAMIGCNLEDFKVRGLYFGYQAISSFINCSFLPKTIGTYEEEIKLTSSSHILSFKNCYITSKGSTRNSTSSVVISNTLTNFDSNTSDFDSYYSVIAALKYSMPKTSLVNQEYGVYTQKTPYVTFDRNYGFNLQLPIIWTANTTTFSITGQSKIKTANTVSTTITNATGGKEGQEMYLEIKDTFTIISHLSSGTGKFKLLKGSNLTAINGEVYHFIYDGTIWVEVGSENSIYSKIDSPTFTGVPLAPTAASGTNTTQIATTAFAQGIRPYKVYTAILTQVGTSAPTAIVLENTIGSIVWSRSVIGGYFATLSGAFTTDKTSVLITNGSANSTYIHGASVSTSNVNVITALDGQIDRATIEIRVYN